MTATTDLHFESGGSGAGGTLILLHGLGANSVVWKPMLKLIQKHWDGKWIAPDFRGHGRSPFGGPYGYAAHASDIARIIDAKAVGPVCLVGHSFGGVVGSLVSTGLFGPRVAGLFSVGVKLYWDHDEILRGKQAATNPQPAFDDAT